MNRTAQRTIRLMITLLLIPVGAATAQAQDLTWHSIDGGGGTATGGLFELSGTIGQPDAGVTMTSGSFELTGGFWPGVAAESCYADCDSNGVLDIFDFLCFRNSFVNGELYACDCDPDPVCDIFDFLCFQNAFVAGCP